MSSPEEKGSPPEGGEEQASLEVVDAPTVKETSKDGEKPPDPLATVSEVFSFAQTSKVKVCLGVGIFCAAVTGCSFPALAWVCFFLFCFKIYARWFRSQAKKLTALSHSDLLLISML